MGTHVTLGERGHGEFRRRQRGDWRFTALDAVDDDGGTFPRFVRGHVAVVPEGHSLQSARTPGLDHAGLSASGVDAHTEPREVPVPEDGILGLNGERIDGALGESEFASLGHGASARGMSGVRYPSSNRNRQTSNWRVLNRRCGASTNACPSPPSAIGLQRSAGAARVLSGTSRGDRAGLAADGEADRIGQ